MKKILSVDDSMVVRKMVKISLAEQYELHEAKDGAEGFELAKQHQFDLVITDINMPVMDGIEMIGHLRQMPNYQKTPILCITTESSAATKERGKAVGANGWIVKPFTPETLRNIVLRFTA
ncbi:response regulator [Thiomicrospira microaerophila]|uniref:response regulator n=1 Tax=Thiomicrospira microaerophila TaxID=406020 RepID=UPI0005C9322F|nr:response regulator [Thiomicrospira microaerophila]